MPEEFPDPEGPDNLNEPPSFFPYDDEPVHEPGTMGELIEVQIEGIYQGDSPSGITRYVLVTDGERRLPILIGGFEAHAISASLENVHPDRPMTHDLLKNVIERLDATVDRIVIDDLWNEIYYAKIYLKTGKEEYEIDCRPSDAIAMAVRFNAAIFVADGILESGNEGG